MWRQSDILDAGQNAEVIESFDSWAERARVSVQTATANIIPWEPFEFPDTNVTFNSYEFPWGIGLLKFNLVCDGEERSITFSLSNERVSFPGFITPRVGDDNLVAKIIESRYWETLQATHLWERVSSKSQVEKKR